MDSVAKYLEGYELAIMPTSLFNWIESFDKNKYDQVMDALSHFDNEFEDEAEIVFHINGNQTEYFKISVAEGEIELELDDKVRPMIIIDELSKITEDEFLDNILEGNKISINKDIQRVLIKYNYL